MRTLLSITFCALFFIASAQDSTKISIAGVSDKYQRISNELNNIQLMSINNADSLMNGKRFLLTIQEFDRGIAHEVDSFISLETKRFYVMLGSDSAVYILDPASSISRASKCTDDSSCNYTIDIALKNEGDSSMIYVKYPGISTKFKLKANNDYSLRTINIPRNETPWITLNRDVPILAYTPGSVQGAFTGYCILNTDKPENWYSTFGIEHYYIIYLNIF